MYELVSRQVVNYQKLSVYFSSNIDPVIRKEIQQCLGIIAHIGLISMLHLVGLRGQNLITFWIATR